MYILGQQGIARGVRSVNRDHVLQLLEVSISYPFSYFSPLFLWNIKFDRFYFLDVFFMATQKNESKKLGFSCFCGGWWVRTCSQKKMAEGPLVCHFSGEMRPCVGWGTVPDFTSPPSPCTTPQQVLLREADSFVLKGFYPISRGPVLDGPGWVVVFWLGAGASFTCVEYVNSHLKEIILSLCLVSSYQQTVWVQSALQMKRMRDS